MCTWIIHRCYGHARQLLAAEKQVAKLQRQLAQAKAHNPNLPPDTIAAQGPNFTKMCMYLHSCVQSDSNSQKNL